MEPVADSEKSSIYVKLHKDFEKYKTLFKSSTQAPLNAKEDDATAAVGVEAECKALLEQMKQSVNKQLENIEPGETQFPRLFALKCALMFEEGRVLAHFGEEELGLKAMAQALQLSAHHRHHPEFTYLSLKICNTSSYLESRRGKHEEAYNILEEARAIYQQISDENADFFTIDELCSKEPITKSKPETKILLELLVTNNFQMLAFVCNKLGRTEEYFKYSHEVLERQLRNNESEPTLWATKVGRLAFGFMSQTRFRESRHHLAAVYHILKKYDSELKTKSEDAEGIAAKNEKLRRTEADMAKLWVKYCLYLLSASKKRLISTFYSDANDVIDNMWIPRDTNEEAGDEGSVTTDPQPEVADFEAPSSLSAGTSSDVKTEEAITPRSDGESSKDNHLEQVSVKAELKNNEEECLSTGEIKTEEDDSSSQCKEEVQREVPQENLILFPTLDLGDIEEQVTADLVETTEQARVVVTFAHSWLRRSKIYYNISQYPTEYINSILDLSDLYRYLAFFEEDVENQHMVQKNRADALETLNTTLRDLRPPCHLTITIELLRELAEVQLELVGLNLRRLFSIKGTYDEGDSELGPSNVLQKMGALADLHGRLEHFGDSFAFVTEPIIQGFCETVNDTLQQCS